MDELTLSPVEMRAKIERLQWFDDDLLTEFIRKAPVETEPYYCFLDIRILVYLEISRLRTALGYEGTARLSPLGPKHRGWSPARRAAHKKR